MDLLLAGRPEAFAAQWHRTGIGLFSAVSAQMQSCLGRALEPFVTALKGAGPGLVRGMDHQMAPYVFTESESAVAARDRA